MTTRRSGARLHVRRELPARLDRVLAIAGSPRPAPRTDSRDHAVLEVVGQELAPRVPSREKPSVLCVSGSYRTSKSGRSRRMTAPERRRLRAFPRTGTRRPAPRQRVPGYRQLAQAAQLLGEADERVHDLDESQFARSAPAKPLVPGGRWRAPSSVRISGHWRPRRRHPTRPRRGFLRGRLFRSGGAVASEACGLLREGEGTRGRWVEEEPDSNGKLKIPSKSPCWTGQEQVDAGAGRRRGSSPGRPGADAGRHRTAARCGRNRQAELAAGRRFGTATGEVVSHPREGQVLVHRGWGRSGTEAERSRDPERINRGQGVAATLNLPDGDGTACGAVLDRQRLRSPAAQACQCRAQTSTAACRTCVVSEDAE